MVRTLGDYSVPDFHSELAVIFRGTLYSHPVDCICDQNRHITQRRAQCHPLEVLPPGRKVELDPGLRRIFQDGCRCAKKSGQQEPVVACCTSDKGVYCAIEFLRL